MKRRMGTIQVYTGNGKGKTTAALGLAMRSLGHGLRVFMVQFMKGKNNSGEVILAKKLRGFTIVQAGRNRFVRRKNRPDPEDVGLATLGLDKARKAIRSGKYDLVILDEINVAADYRLVKVRDVLELLSEKPREVELVLTGRSAPGEFIRAADTVSRIVCVQHHYEKGIPARKGVEY